MKRRATPLYISMLAALSRPATTTQLGERLGYGTLVNLRHALRLMRQHGLVHVCGWAAGSRNGGIESALWLAGPGIEPAPRNGRMPLPRLINRNPEMIVFVALVRALKRGPLTAIELAEETGVTTQTMYLLLRQMIEGGLIHIERWDRSARIPQAAYLWGAGLHAPRPKAENKRAIELRSYAKRVARAGQTRMMRALSANAVVFSCATSA